MGAAKAARKHSIPNLIMICTLLSCLVLASSAAYFEHNVERNYAKLLRRELHQSVADSRGSSRKSGLLNLGSGKGTKIHLTVGNGMDLTVGNDTDLTEGNETDGNETLVADAQPPDGVCVVTNGVQTKKDAYVQVVADNSDCGDGVKELAANLTITETPLLACAELAEDDADCGGTFQMVDDIFKCSCAKGSKNGVHDCGLQNETKTCVYKLSPPVCKNTTGVEFTSHEEEWKVNAVYPNQFAADCAGAIDLTGDFSSGLEACAKAAANSTECGDTFWMERENQKCMCLKAEVDCEYEDSADMCQYQLISLSNTVEATVGDIDAASQEANASQQANASQPSILWR